MVRLILTSPGADPQWRLTNDAVGMLALTPEMNATLRTPTQPASADDDTPLIQLDVFHQVRYC